MGKPTTVVRGALAFGLLAAVALPISGGRASAQTNEGTSYWLTFLPNLVGGTVTNTVSITAPTAGTATVTGGGMANPIHTSFFAGEQLNVTLPLVTLEDNTVATNAFHVVTSVPVTLDATNEEQDSTDGYLVLPTAALGMEYFDLGYAGFGTGTNSQLAVVATANNTTVTITPSVTLDADRQAGTPFTKTLNAGQTYAISVALPADEDLSGTLVTANHPVALLGGHQCAQVPVGDDYCNHLVEQLPPTDQWGRTFVTTPLATRTGGDIIRVVGSVDGTTLTNVGGTDAPVSINRGNVDQWTQTGPMTLTSSQPILVAQYSTSEQFDNDSDGDPFMVLVPPAEQYLADYTFSTAPVTATSYLGIMVPSAAASSVRLDGAKLPPGSLSAISGSTGWSQGSVEVPVGGHRVTAALPFGAQVYGYGAHDQYGYLAGLNLASVALTHSVTVSPATSTAAAGQRHCLTLKASSASGAGISGVRIDIAVTGANPARSFAFANSSGVAMYCTADAKSGTDRVTASVGQVTGGAVVKRLPAAVTHLVARPGIGRVVLSWKNPNAAHFASTSIVRMATGTHVPGPKGGKLIYSGHGDSVTKTNLHAGRSYTFAVFVRDAAGHLSTVVSRKLLGSSIVIRGSAASIIKGRAVHINATLDQGGSHHGVRGERLQLLERAHGTSAYHAVTTARTKVGGRATFLVELKHSTDFRWGFAGAGDRLGCYSRVLTVSVS